MQPDDFGHKDPNWCFWRGKLGWEGFPKNSWKWLDQLHDKAESEGREISAVLDIGGWDYHIHMDPLHFLKSEDAVGYQVAMHENSNKKVRKIKNCW